MFTGQLYEEIKLLQDDIEAVHDKVDDPVICEKVRLFVESPKEFQEIFKTDAGMDGHTIYTHYFELMEQ